MIEDIHKFNKTTRTDFRFTVLMPTWNNLAYLKNCVRSIRKNSFFPIQIVVIVNEGADGSLEWVKNQDDIDYIHAMKNIGICYALNIARSLIKTEYVIYVNDDMYLLPGWDIELDKEITCIGSKSFMLSSTLIEPTDTGNPCVIVKDYGKNLDEFNEEMLLHDYSDLYIDDWSGSTWPPNLVHIDMWDLIGGMSIEFSPGFYSDPDISRKLFEAGVRIFKGKGNSLAYHFGSKSTGRVNKNNGRKTFILKWGISSNVFINKYLNSGKKYPGKAVTPALTAQQKLINTIKRLKSCF